MPIRLTPLALLLLFLPGLSIAAEPPRVEYRFTELQRTAGTDLLHFSGGALNENGQAAWLALYNDGLCFEGNCGVFVGDGGTPTQVVTTVGTDYVFLDEPDINDAGDVVFHGAQSVDPGDPEADIYKGIYLWEPGSDLERILVVGDLALDIVVPGVDRWVVLSAFNSEPKINNSDLILVPLEIFDGNIPGIGRSATLPRIAVYQRATQELHWLYQAGWYSDLPPDTWDYADFIWGAYFNDSNEILAFGEAIPAGGGTPDMFTGSWLKGGVDPASPFDPLPWVDVANNTTDLAELRIHAWLNESGHVLYQGRPSPADTQDGIFIMDTVGLVTTVLEPDVDNDDGILFGFCPLPPCAGSVVVMNSTPEVAFEAQTAEHSSALLLWNPTDGMRRVIGEPGFEPPLRTIDGELLPPGKRLLSFNVLDINDQGSLLLRLVLEDTTHHSLSEMLVIGSPAPEVPPLIETGEYDLFQGGIILCALPAPCEPIADFFFPLTHSTVTISADPTGSTAEIAFSLEFLPGSYWLPETFSVSGPITETPEGASINASGTLGEMPDQIQIQLLFDFPPAGVTPGPTLDLFEASGSALHPFGEWCEFSLVRGQLVPEPAAALLQIGAFLCLVLLRRLRMRRLPSASQCWPASTPG